jgi:hypothetical protein
VSSGDVTVEEAHVSPGDVAYDSLGGSLKLRTLMGVAGGGVRHKGWNAESATAEAPIFAGALPGWQRETLDCALSAPVPHSSLYLKLITITEKDRKLIQ